MDNEKTGNPIYKMNQMSSNYTKYVTIRDLGISINLNGVEAVFYEKLCDIENKLKSIEEKVNGVR